jgi:hypothetical protein
MLHVYFVGLVMSESRNGNSHGTRRLEYSLYIIYQQSIRLPTQGKKSSQNSIRSKCFSGQTYFGFILEHTYLIVWKYLCHICFAAVETL